MSEDVIALPVSFGQQRLWFLDQLVPGSAFYNVPQAVRLIGNLNVAALQDSLNEIVRRHEVLRTTFATVDGEPVQIPAPSMTVTVAVKDLRSVPEHERLGEAARLAEEEARQPFNLATGPLLRATILTLNEGDCVGLFTMHHIVADVWSMEILIREVAALYQAFADRRPSPLPELSIQYADFAIWQREWLQGGRLEAQLSYWKQQLGGDLPVLDLPADLPRPATQTHRGATQSLMLSEDLTESLKALSRKHGLTFFMTLVAAFKALLCRYTGQEDILVGTPITNRDRAEVEGLIGFFVNTLVLRTDVSGDPTFRELLGRVRDVALGAYAHQEIPFEKLVDELRIERDLSHTPLFQVMFLFEPAPKEELNMPGLKILPFPTGSGAAKFDLTLQIAEVGAGLAATFEYNCDLFERETIARMLRHFERLLGAVAADEDQRVSALPMMTESELDRILVRWNDTRASYPEDSCIHNLFEAQAERTPHAIAVVSAQQRLTYQGLNARANRLAHHLRGLGVGPEARVGLLMERSVDMAVSLLSILKAGGAYVPLDPSYPRDRLDFVIEDASLSVVLTHQELLGKVSRHASHFICLDSDGAKLASESRSNPVNKTLPENPAYVIYTSGSTGKPKGVLVSHRNLVHSTTARVKYYREPVSAFLLLSSIAFDSSIAGIFWTLCQGGSLCLPKQGGQQDVEYLADTIEGNQVSHLLCLPSLYALLLGQAKQLGSLNTVIVAGEECQKEVVNAHQMLMGRASLFNEYGPTEGTVWSSVYEFPDGPALRHVPIGRPIPNMQVYVLDSHLRPVPPGVKGEIYIGGEGISRGYLNRADATAERFIPNCFSARPGDRLYRTGDRARYLPSGDIEFLGRNDHQVKIRGYRIEIGEIEAALREHPSVQEAAVLAREERPGHKLLVAYVVARQGGSIISELHSLLSRKLPEHMIPSAFVLMDKLPLTPNGKLDRRALPAPERSGVESGRPYAEPRTPVEEALVELWREALRRERIGVHHNFFDLGGNSLLATQVVSRLRKAFQVDLPLRSWFEAPTVAQQAGVIEKALRTGATLHAPQIEPAPRDINIPLSFAQERLWFLDQMEPGASTYNIPGAIRLGGALDVQAVEDSLTELLKRHESLRTRFQIIEGKPYQVIDDPTPFTLPLLHLNSSNEQDREAEARDIIMRQAREPFNLSTGPLIRAALIRLAERDHVLSFTMHHIISDAWSMGVLTREIVALYQAYHSGKEPSLAQLPIQYADFAVWQREWLQGGALDEQMSYWREQLGGELPALDLPTDRRRTTAASNEGGLEGVELSEELSASLKDLSRREGVTLFMTLLAAMQTLLYRLSSQEDIIVGTPIAGRSRVEVEGLIGFFVNTLVIRTNLGGRPGFRELLRRVREVVLGAYAHQDVPFEKLVEELQPERDLNRTPLFQAMFVFQNAPVETFELADLKVSFLKAETGTAKFDLTLTLTEAEGKILGGIEYNKGRFDPATIKRIGRHFNRLIESIVDDPDQSISLLPMLTQEERKRLLVDFNQTSSPLPSPSLLHRLFEDQVARSPHSTALVFDSLHLSYSLLNRFANQLAHFILSLNLPPEPRIAVCLPRSLDLVVSLLAVLKAGGAYLPLDPSYPKNRLSSMLDDARVQFVLSLDSLSHLLPPDLPALFLDLQQNLLSSLSDRDPALLLAEDSLAYVIFTSGSTGRPKGAMNTHRAISNRLLWMQDRYELSPADRVLQKTPFSFDVSVWEFFWPLITGSALVVAPPDAHHDSRELTELIRREQVSVIHFVPSMLQAVLQEEGVEQCRSLRLVISSGEELKPEVESRYWAKLSAGLHNLYGPTEAAVDVSSWECRKGEGEGRSRVPIGMPIWNTRMYILDEEREPVAEGVEGEIYIGGVGLARGYEGRADLTAERFEADKHSRAGGERVYRTGDIGRRLESGEIEYVGRKDGQVKVRGNRVEMGEVEREMMKMEWVREAAVVARKEVDGDVRLVAYVVPDKQAPPGIGELRNHLRSRLPEFMLPSAFVIMDSLPLSPNGKLDRRMLPSPDKQRSEPEADFIAPRSPAEEMLASILAEVLRIERVGVNDNFFNLGGHSLLAVLIMSRVRKVFRVDLPLRRLFEGPTVAELARKVEAAIKAGQGILTLPIQPTSRKNSIPLSFAQERLWFVDQLESGSAFYNISDAFRLEGELHVPALEHSLNEIVRRHEILRTTFALIEGSPAQVIAPSLALTVPLVDLRLLSRGSRELEIARLINEDMWLPFDLERGPLLRARILCVSENEHVLLLAMHHIISDGWSLGIFIQELKNLYQGSLTGQLPQLPELPIQYADYAVWQREALNAGQLEPELSYWQRQLAGMPRTSECPIDKPRPERQTYFGANSSRTLPGELSAAIKAFSGRENMTLFMVALAAFKLLLYYHTRQKDFVVGTPIANRGRAGTEGLIGPFINLIALRTTLGDDMTFRELTDQVREVTLGAYAHQELPFDKLVESLQLERDVSRTLVFQVMFAVQNAPPPEVGLSGIRFSKLEAGSVAAHYDILMYLEDTGEEFTATAIYNTDLFEPATISLFLRQYELILRDAVAGPEMLFGDLLKKVAEADAQEADRQAAQLKESNVRKLKSIRRRSSAGAD